MTGGPLTIVFRPITGPLAFADRLPVTWTNRSSCVPGTRPSPAASACWASGAPGKPGTIAITGEEMKAQQLIETLESRTLLSASMVNGSVNVRGSDGSDLIVVYVESDGKTLSVLVANDAGAQVHSFARSAVKHLHLDGGAGNDVIVLDEAMGALPRAKLFGG